jgi:hypothetical protein
MEDGGGDGRRGEIQVLAQKVKGLRAGFYLTWYGQLARTKGVRDGLHLSHCVSLASRQDGVKAVYPHLLRRLGGWVYTNPSAPVCVFGRTSSPLA